MNALPAEGRARVVIEGIAPNVDHGRFAALFHHGADFGQFDEDDVAQLALRVIGDADRREVTLEIDPFVFVGEITGHAYLLPR